MTGSRPATRKPVHYRPSHDRALWSRVSPPPRQESRAIQPCTCFPESNLPRAQADHTRSEHDRLDQRQSGWILALPRDRTRPSRSVPIQRVEKCARRESARRPHSDKSLMSHSRCNRSKPEHLEAKRPSARDQRLWQNPDPEPSKGPAATTGQAAEVTHEPEPPEPARSGAPCQQCTSNRRVAATDSCD